MQVKAEPDLPHQARRLRAGASAQAAPPCSSGDWGNDYGRLPPTETPRLGEIATVNRDVSYSRLAPRPALRLHATTSRRSRRPWPEPRPAGTAGVGQST